MRILSTLSLALLVAGSSAAAEPCVSGLRPGQRPGPYSFLVSVGPQRGTSHCFICETADRPAVVVFARSLSDPLGRLVRGMDRAMTDNKSADLRGWVTLLHEGKGEFWAHESYDHYVRDAEEWNRIIAYVLNNPVKARYVADWRDWKWNYRRE